MLERRNSARLPLSLKIREANGDYLYTWTAANLGEEGVFLLNKVCFSSQEPFSRISLTLPNGRQLHNLTARIVREVRHGQNRGCALEFLNLREDERLDLRRFFLAQAAS